MASVLYEKKGELLYVTLNRPDVHNAWDPETVVRLADAWRDFAADDSLRVAIITGAGDRSFSSGADLKRLIPLLYRSREPEDEWDNKVLQNSDIARTALLRGYELHKPIIAAINGFCLAGGMELIQATDIRIAAEHATFGLTEVKRAIIPAGGSLVRLARQIPYCHAMEILLTGESISAEDAQGIGLINRVVPADELMSTAEGVAAKIAENGPLAVRKIKETVLKTIGLPLAEAFAVEDDAVRSIRDSEDAVEGPLAFAEKRKPRYVGK
ncbi:MAG: enoyl-CoA hydratase/isomerase family protein [Chloroflexi bacterium]|nr:enoyl-CoA hydratase/isomerase family protein [Chloroflexota bacterium]